MYLGEPSRSAVALFLEGVTAWEKSDLAVAWSILQGGGPLRVLFFVSNRYPDCDYFFLVFGGGEC